MLKIIILSGLILTALDVSFLTLTASIYANQIKAVQNMPLSINYTYAIFSYITIIFALNHFILLKDSSVLEAGILGISIYAIFEFTNAALFSNWKLSTIFLDTLWGGVLFGTVTGLVNVIKPYINA